MKTLLMLAALFFVASVAMAQKTDAQKVTDRQTELRALDAQLQDTLTSKTAQIDVLYKEIKQIEEKRQALAGAIAGLEESVKAIEGKPTTFTATVKAIDAEIAK